MHQSTLLMAKVMQQPILKYRHRILQWFLSSNTLEITKATYTVQIIHTGDVSDTFNFTISRELVGSAYLLVQVYGSYFQDHTIMINGQEVTGPQGSFGSTGFGNWATLTVLVDDNILKQGQNTIQFLRNPDTPDNFLIDNVVVNWRYQLPQQ
jgi:hypothetical protein